MNGMLHLLVDQCPLLFDWKIMTNCKTCGNETDMEGLLDNSFEQLKSVLFVQELAFHIKTLSNREMVWEVTSNRIGENYRCTFIPPDDMSLSDVFERYIGPAVICINKLRGEA